MPATTVTSGGPVLRVAIGWATRSSEVSAAASPVDPATTTARIPRSTRVAAWSAVALGSISPSSSNSVASATPTPVNSGSAIAHASSPPQLGTSTRPP